MQARYALPWLVVASVVLACGVVLGAEGQEAAKKEEPKQEPLTVKVYRVEDLFVRRDWTPNQVGFPDVLDGMTGAHGTAMAAADTGGEAGRMFGVSVGVSSASQGAISGATELVDIIKRTVNKMNNPKVAAWGDEGGPAAIECLAAQDAVSLIVTQTPEGHEKVAELLGGLLAERDVSGPVVTISAQWVEVDEGKARQLVVGRDPKRLVPMAITAADIEKAGAKVVYRGVTSCFDRQTVFVSSGKLKAYLADVMPSTNADAVVIRPNTRYLLVGALLEVRPQLSKAFDTVILDFRSFVNQNGAVEYRPIPDFVAVRGQNAMRVDLGYPEVDFHTLRGSIRIPLDKTILVGGCTSAKMKDGKVLYLVVEASASKDPREAAAETPKK